MTLSIGPSCGSAARDRPTLGEFHANMIVVGLVIIVAHDYQVVVENDLW